MTHALSASAPIAGRVQSGPDPAFPNGLLAALDRLEQSTALAEYIPARFLKLFAELKRKEYAAVIEELFIQEFDFYL
jgi:glutamine synthetase